MDKVDHDKAIVKAAEALRDKFEHDTLVQCAQEVRAVHEAVNAKRAAQAPHLLTAEEADEMIQNNPEREQIDDCGVIISACHARAFAVIEALPRYVPAVRITQGERPPYPLAVSENALIATERCAVLIHDIRAALGVGK